MKHNQTTKPTHSVYKLSSLWISLLLAPLVMSGCATLSKEECMLGNWQSIGYNDGVEGHLPSYVSKHQKACAKASVTPDYKAWESGRQQGLKQYCTESNAYRLGRLGITLNNVCPIDSIDKLQKLNEKGKVIYSLNQKISSNQNKISAYKKELTQLKNGEMLDFTNEKQARQYMLTLPVKINELNRDIQQYQWELDSLTYR